jgi:hypothetical protein
VADEPPSGLNDELSVRSYSGAATLAEDLGRFLRNEPVLARPVGQLERLVKWSRRRPAVAALRAVSVAAAPARPSRTRPAFGDW